MLAGLESADFLFVQNQTGLTGGNLSSPMTRLGRPLAFAGRPELEHPAQPRRYLRK
jgi:hypothetical protein